uniref:Uncharacterized protein n=1 Tax=Panagrellus redivivus TaxID=6233 RepID=A0A7E4UZ29_PANRE
MYTKPSLESTGSIITTPKTPTNVATPKLPPSASWMIDWCTMMHCYDNSSDNLNQDSRHHGLHGPQVSRFGNRNPGCIDCPIQ